MLKPLYTFGTEQKKVHIFTNNFQGVVAEWIRAPNSSKALMLLFSRVWVRIQVVTLVSLSNTLNYYCFSPARG